jgi:chemotaxis protein CheC
MKEGIVLTETQKDALREIGNICAGNAATAISQLLNKKIDIVVPTIYFLPTEEVPDVVGGANALVAGLVLRVFGDLPSIIIFIFSQNDALKLASLMTGKQLSESSILGELEQSALKEIGIVLTNAYVGALSSFVGMGFVPSVPQLIIDMAGAIVDYLLIELSCKSSFALLIDSEFCEPTTSIKGRFLIIPNPEGLKIILKTINNP